MKNVKTTKLTFCAMSIALILFAGFLTATVEATVSPNVNLSKLTGYQGETTIAIDPTNPNRMFAASNIGSGSGMFAAYSTDGGTTWAYTDPTDKVIGDGDPDNVPAACCDPIAIFDKFGNLYLAYLSSGIAVRVVVSTNGGQSFSGTNFAGEEFGNFPVPGDKDKPYAELERKGDGKEDGEGVINQSGDQPTIATGPSFFAGEASVYVSWNGGGVIRTAGTRASGLGAITPFDNTFIATPVAGNYGDIEVGPIGQVLVTAQVATGGQGPTNINVSLDPDGLGPANFNQQTSIPINQKPIYMSIIDNFGAAVLVTSTNVGGFDFIPAQPNRSVDAEADLSWDKSGGANNGRVYLAYTEETVNENNDMDILVRFSNNNGATWSAPVKANDDVTTRSQFLPRIEVDQTTGYVAVAFYDARNSAGNNTTQVFGAVSFNGGTSFATTVFWGDGTGKFTDGRATILPNPASFVATYDIKAEDIDGDGRRDLVLLRITSDLQGYYFQILRQTSARVFIDESISRIIKNAATWEGIGAEWFPWIHMKDLNGDGKPDLAIGEGSRFIPSRNFKWINNGTGVFNKVP